MTATRSRTPHLPLQALAGLFIALAACAFIACSNSEMVADSDIGIVAGNNEWEQPFSNSGYTPNTEDIDESSSSKALDYLPLDDTEYPYAGIPRIVIETEDLREIKDRETEIPAKLQIWGEKAPETEIMELTIRGRGNSSWGMPQKSYKIEFVNKQAMLGMPKDRDWALIANYADKTLMKNYLMYNLSKQLGASYAPRCKFVDLYLNKEYLGVYLLTETVKIGKNRVNIPKNEQSYLIEFDLKKKDNDQYIIPFQERIYNIHFPQKASDSAKQTFTAFIRNFEEYLKKEDFTNSLSQWIDIDAYIKHYWIQEFSSNPDAKCRTSVFFTWQVGKTIQMGPVWDFDLSMGGHPEDVSTYSDWLIRNSCWDMYLFKDSTFSTQAYLFWKGHQKTFQNILDSIDNISSWLQFAAENNFKKWNILGSTKNHWHSTPYKTYNDAIADLKLWLRQRIDWINKQYQSQQILLR